MSAFPAGRPISESGFFTDPWRMFLLGIYNKTGGASGITYASSITNVPAGHITATDVQAALNQLDLIKGTVNSFTFTDANGITGTVLNPTTTPSLTLALGAITPTSVAAVGAVTGSNLSGTNTGDETGVRIAAINHAASVKSALLDTDEITGQDSAASFGLIRTTWTSVKAFLKTYFDTLYQPVDATLTALAGANWAANALPIGSGADAVAQVSFAANTFPARASTGNLVAKTITDFGLSLVDDADAAAGRTTLGLGTLATQSGTFSGTSSGTNTGDETGARLATLHHAASVKSALVDADEVTGGDSAASFGLIRTTWTSVKAFLKTANDLLYQPLLATLTSWGAITRAAGFDTFATTPSSANLAALVTDEDGTGLIPFEATGLWTPVLTFATPGTLSLTYASQVGIYTKIGRLVTLHFNVSTSSFTLGTAAGVLTFSGLPFAAAAGFTQTAGSVFWSGITKATYTQVVPSIASSASTITFQASGSGVGGANVNATDTPSGGTVTLRGQISYFV